MTSCRRCDIIESAKMYITGRFAFVSHQTQFDFVGKAPFLYGFTSCLRLGNGGRNVQEGRFDMDENEELTEEWRAIHDFPGYEVSNLGRVRSFYKRIYKRGISEIMWGISDKPQCLLAQQIHGRGYRGVSLHRDKGPHSRTVHRLVTRAFLGQCPDGQQVCHNDSDKTNNALSNLRYDTQTANMQDRVRRAAENQTLKLSDADVLLMRQLAIEGAAYTELGKRFNVSTSTARSACIGGHYQWAEGPLSKVRRKLGQSRANQVRTDFENGASRQALKHKYNISRKTLSHVLANKIWISDQPNSTKRKE